MLTDVTATISQVELTPERMHSIGLDLGVQSGSIVAVESILANGIVWIVSWRVLQVWYEGPKVAKASVNEIPALVDFIQRQTLPMVGWLESTGLIGSGIPIAVDWDPRDAFWGDRKQSALKSFMMGWLYRQTTTYGMVPLLMPPSYVRGHFALPRNAAKETVWMEATQSVIQPGWVARFAKLSEHSKDAVILALLAVYATLGIVKHPSGNN